VGRPLARGNAINPRAVGPGVKVGAFTVLDPAPGEPGGERERLLDAVGLAEAAEAAGLSSFWVAEHHFQGGGLCPSPPVLLAACGARTRAIRLGSLVSVLPFHRPVEVAEEYAMLDRLIGGRLNFGVGSGYLASEFAGFGLDPATKRERFDGALQTVLDAFAGRAVRAGPEPAAPVVLNVRPQQAPHPPIWIAVQRREAIPYVARRGASLALIPYATVDRLDDLAAQVHDYRSALPPGRSGEVAAAVHLYAGDQPELARRAFGRYVESRLESGSTFLRQKQLERPAHASPQAIEESGLAAFGTPEEVVRSLERYAALGIDELLGIFDFGGLPADEVLRSVRRVGEAWRRRSQTL